MVEREIRRLSTDKADARRRAEVLDDGSIAAACAQ